MREDLDRHRSKIMYLLVGGWNTFFGYGSFVLLYYFLSARIHATVILTLCYILSITNAYIGYKIFVFKTKGNVIREYFRFYVVYGGAYVINLVSLPVFMGYWMLNAYVSQALITMITMAGSYVLHRNYTFKKSKLV